MVDASFLFDEPWVYVTGSTIAILGILFLTFIFKCVYYFKKACLCSDSGNV